jgi:hypothetical protein
MHDLSLCTRSNEAQLRNASTDQRNTRAIWRALRKRTQKREAIRRFDKCVSIVDDEDQLTVWRREIGNERRRTYGWRLLLANRSRETRQAHAIILIGGEMERVTQVATCPQPPHRSVGANAPRCDGAALSVSGTAANECQPSVSELVECGIDAGPSWMNTRGLHHRAVLHVAPPQAAPAGRLGGY